MDSDLASRILALLASQRDAFVAREWDLLDARSDELARLVASSEGQRLDEASRREIRRQWEINDLLWRRAEADLALRARDAAERRSLGYDRGGSFSPGRGASLLNVQA